MRKEIRPRFDPLTEVPVVPTHEDLEGRDEEGQHPISAIEGLQQALDGKVGAEQGKGLSTEDYTSAEKAKLAGISPGAEPNTIQTIYLNSNEINPGPYRDVHISIPPVPDGIVVEDGAIGLVSGGSTLSTAAIRDAGAVRFGAWDEGSLVLTTDEGDQEIVLPPYEAGAEVNAIEGVTVNGVALQPDADRVVDVDVPTRAEYAGQLVLDSSDRLVLKAADGSTLSLVPTDLPKTITAASFDAETETLVLTRKDGTALRVGLGALIPPYAGDGSTITTSPSAEGIVISVDQAVLDAIDSAVHKAGTEEVTGSKSFTKDLEVHANVPKLRLWSTRGDEVRNQQLATINYIMTPDGAEVTQGAIDTYSYVSSVILRLRAWNHGRTASASAELHCTDDGATYLAGPVRIVTDGEGAVQPTSERVFVTGGMLAVDPQVVHTYGSETVAGAKTFTGTVTTQAANHVTVRKSTTVPAGGAKTLDTVRYLDGSDAEMCTETMQVNADLGWRSKRCEVVSPDGAHTAAFRVIAYNDGRTLAKVTSYLPTDGSGRPVAVTGEEIITGAMLAAAPNIVHTSGDEEVAGTKAFASLEAARASISSLTLDGSISMGGAMSSKTVCTASVQTEIDETGQTVERGWYCLYELTTSSVSQNYTLLLWSCPDAPVLASSYSMGTLMASVRGASGFCRWMSGGPSSDAGRQKTALVLTKTVRSSTTDPDTGAVTYTYNYKWQLWQKADRTVTGRYCHRLAEHNHQGPVSVWAPQPVGASMAQESLPEAHQEADGTGVWVYYSTGGSS